MPQSCVAYGCNNRGKIEGVTYHSFPADEELRRQWVNAVKREKWTPSKHSRLCSVHFREEDLDRTLLRVKVRDGVVPVIFPAFSNVKERRGLKRKRVLDDSEVTTEAVTPSYSKSPTKQKLKIELNKANIILKKRNVKIKKLQQNKRRLLKRVAKLEDVIDVLRKKLNIREESCSLLTSISKNSDCLIKRSIEKTQNPALKKTYNERLKSFAITLHFLSPKAYTYVRKTFNSALPHPRTLRRWYSSVNAEPGFSEEVFRALKEHSENSANRPICSLMLDCMAIRKHLEWDGKRFHGTINAGGNVTCDDDSAPLATEALVFHLVFINDCWKIPLGHFFVDGVSGEQLSGLVKQCLNLLHDANIEVASLTSDGTACNIAMANSLGCNITPKNLVSWLPHPTTNEPIFFFFDPSHMIKLVRNTLGDGKVLLNSKGERIEWRYIEQLHQLQVNEGLRLGNKLTQTHINYIKQKMKVKLAVQLLSRSVAESLEYLKLKKVPGFEECSSTIEFLRLFDRLFDILNSRSIRAKYDKQALNPKNYELHSEFLIIAKEYISELKDGCGVPILVSRRKTGFIGLLVCIDSTFSMYNKYVNGENKPLKYLPIYKVSQDHLERLFGYIRSRGGHNNNPTCREFTGSFKRILLHKELVETNTGNALALNKSLIFSLNRRNDEIGDINTSIPGWRGGNYTYEIPVTEEEAVADGIEEEFLLSIFDSTTDVACDIVEYVAGFVVRQIQKKIACESCLGLLIKERSKCNSLIYCKNRGGLIQPSDGVVKICLICEAIVKNFLNSNKITTTANVTEVLISKVLKNCIGLTLFNTDHYNEQEFEQNHLILLLKSISRKYFNVRLFHYSKQYNDKLHTSRVRHHLTKVVTFLGQ